MARLIGSDHRLAHTISSEHHAGIIIDNFQHCSESERWWSAMNHPLLASILAHRIKQRDRATMVEIIRRDPQESLPVVETHTWQKKTVFFFKKKNAVVKSTAKAQVGQVGQNLRRKQNKGAPPLRQTPRHNHVQHNMA